MNTKWTPFSYNLLTAVKDPSAASIKDIKNKMLKAMRDEVAKNLSPEPKKHSTKLH